jgi:agmatine deiminase
MKLILLLLTSTFFIFSNCDAPREAASHSDNKEVITPTKSNSEILYTMPEESEPHEGTWLQWPHQYQYGETYSNRLDATWVAMTKALVKSETVHLVVYDETEKDKIKNLFEDENVSLENIDFKIYKTDDVWVRDNGPIYVKDNEGNLAIQDWGFNGWGNKAKYENCDAIPEKIATDQNQKYVDVNDVMINEGGSVEIDGNGTLMACKSSILNSNRNGKITEDEAEEVFTKYLGLTNFIWLNGKAGLEITDMHIDGFARFGNEHTIVTMSKDDLTEWQVPENDITTLYAATNKDGKKYTFVKLPLTQSNVTTAYGKKLDYQGSYVNYYIANTVVLVPNYNDPNDAVANAIIQKLYPTRKVIGIDVRNLYANGGMIHCVTQQQPK